MLSSHNVHDYTPILASVYPDLIGLKTCYDNQKGKFMVEFFDKVLKKKFHYLFNTPDEYKEILKDHKKQAKAVSLLLRRTV